MKKALILGTGPAQLDAVKYLKENGWRVIACSYTKHGPCLKYVDQFELVNITDVYALEQLAIREKIDLIYSVGSDLAMPSVAEVASRIGLPTFITADTARMLKDKNALREFLALKNISPVKYRCVRGVDDLRGWDIFPAMVKPADSQGQRGIGKADTSKDLYSCFAKAVKYSNTKSVIVEEYLDGPEISANVLVNDGLALIVETSDRLVVTECEMGIPRGHVFPSTQCTGECLDKVRSLVQRCVSALNIMNGPLYFQMKLTDAGPRIIEITPRLDGCHIWRLIKEVKRIDLLDATFRLLTKQSLECHHSVQKKRSAYLIFFFKNRIRFLSMNIILRLQTHYITSFT